MKRIAILCLAAALLVCGVGCKKTNEADAPAAEEAAVTEEAAAPTKQPGNINEEEQTMATQLPVATIEMEDGGVITVELDYDTAPNTVKNFIALANKGFYDGTIFHRVIEGFMIQGGDPTGTGAGGPGYRIKGEFSNNKVQNDITHDRGVISMARQGNPYMPAAAYNTAGSQFFIMHADSPFLDKDYAAFGHVLSGMDVVDKIATTATDAGDRPVSEQKIKSIRVDTFGADYGEPETIAE